jgi:hypothetical protein
LATEHADVLHEPTACTRLTKSTKNTKKIDGVFLESFFVSLVFFVSVVARRRPVLRRVAVAA